MIDMIVTIISNVFLSIWDHYDVVLADHLTHNVSILNKTFQPSF